MEAIIKRLGEMSQLLLALNDNVVGNNRRLERIEDRISDLVGETRRCSDRLQTVELRIAELAVRLAAVEE